MKPGSLLEVKFHAYIKNNHNENNIAAKITSNNQINDKTTLNNGTSISLYVSIAIGTCLCILIAFISILLLLLLTRNGHVKFLSNYLTSSSSSSSSTASSTTSTITNTKNKLKLNNNKNECDSIDFIKNNTKKFKNQNNLINYNQLGGIGISCSSTATNSSSSNSSSGNNSPMWPPLNSCKTYIDPHTYEDPTKVISHFAKELSPTNIIIEQVIGGGEFGDVCKGILKINPNDQDEFNFNNNNNNNKQKQTIQTRTVAIKTLKGAATEQNRCDFLTEASIMAQFHDENVIKLEGVVTQSNPLMIVTEYMENGSLDQFLRLNESKGLKLTQMIKILKDVASGMKYLSDMNYIHRDLAARNILINKDLVCKVADFGLSREIIDHDSFEYTTRGGKIPIRWTAPEACNFRKYSCASDVWSFGVLAWEVLNFGERPYWNWENKDVVRCIQEFYRLPQPPQNYPCPDCLYKLMLRCWQTDRLQRPKFNEICLLLDEMLHYPQELRKLTKIKELLPINPRQPTKIQLTSTKTFLTRLNLQQYHLNFERVGLGNLSNLFQLDIKDLSISLGIHSPIDQQKIFNELRTIRDSYLNSFKSSSANEYFV